MDKLNTQSCTVCDKGGQLATAEQIQKYMQELPDWKIVAVDDIQQLQACFTWKNFQQALAFTNQVGNLAEAEKHHPALLTEWGKVTVTWWTHSIKGLHTNDFIMAAKTQALLDKV